MNTLQIKIYPLGDLKTNCYLVSNEKEAVLIDPAAPSPVICEDLNQDGLHLNFIINTHGHIDHIGGNTFFKTRFPTARIVIYETEILFLTNADMNLSNELFRPYTSPEPDVFIRGEKHTFDLWEEEVLFLHTPGHTPGSLCLYIPSQQWLFSGDTLFAGSIGRTDLPGGSFHEIIRSLRFIMRTFHDPVRVFPGHGPETTIGEERKTNPYVIEYLGEK
ncbi:MAG: MBL fold metallo-hydrolase [Candidatus Atribacteria bacterium]|nr:MBL fold metallo-hydrolase [Candidatus Atribacteria bacterium]